MQCRRIYKILDPCWICFSVFAQYPPDPFIDKEFVNTYGLNIISGENIHLPLLKDSESEFLISRSTSNEIGFKDPIEAVGKRVLFREYNGHIAGVVDDLNIYSLRQEPYPFTFMITDINNHNYMSIRIHPKDISSTLKYVEKTWYKIIQNYPLDY